MECTWGALFRSLLNPESTLKKLDISRNGNDIDDGALSVLGDMMASNPTLKALAIGGCRGVTSAGWANFFRHLQSSNIALEELGISSINIDDTVIEVLANNLIANTKLKRLDLCYNRSITAGGWQTLFNNLQNGSNFALEVLDLSGNSISDAVVPSTVNALNHFCSLSKLDLRSNPSITSTGRVALSSLLHPNSSLTKLFLSVDDNVIINDGVAISFANALANNTTMRELYFDNDHHNGEPFTLRGWTALAKMYCATNLVPIPFTTPIIRSKKLAGMTIFFQII